MLPKPLILVYIKTMAELPNNTPALKTDEICDDPKIAHFKEMQQEKFARHARLSSIAEASRFIAGPMLAIGISTLITAIAGTGTALVIPMAVPIALLAVGATALATSVASSYKASRIWTDGQFNNYEISAKSTAHHMVQEMKASGLEVVHHEESRSGDGKNWQEYVSTRAAKLGEAQVR